MATLQTVIRYGHDEVDSAVDDRRDGDRVKVLKHVHITDVDGKQTAELGTVIDLTREGMFFTVRSSRFDVGAGVRLTFPDSGSECTCLVVRLQQLPDGRQGVGVRILAW